MYVARQSIRAESIRAEPCRSETTRVEPCRAEPSRAVPSRAVPCRAVPCRTVPCCAVPCRAVPCCAVPCRVVGPRATGGRGFDVRIRPACWLSVVIPDLWPTRTDARSTKARSQTPTEANTVGHFRLMTGAGNGAGISQYCSQNGPVTYSRCCHGIRLYYCVLERQIKIQTKQGFGNFNAHQIRTLQSIVCQIKKHGARTEPFQFLKNSFLSELIKWILHAIYCAGPDVAGSMLLSCQH